MTRRRVDGDLLELLRSYLDGKDAEWSEQPEGSRRPTLPATRDGKVNVRALARELQELGADRGVDVRQSVWQYFYDRSALADEVNVIARAQGLAEIGSRNGVSAAEAALDGKLARTRDELKRQSEGHVEANARVAALQFELVRANAKIARLEERLAGARATGVVVRVADVEE